MTIVQDTLTNEDGQVVEVYMEVDDNAFSYNDIGRDTRGIKDHIPQMEDGFKKSMDLIRVCSEYVTKAVADLPARSRPDGLELQFSIKVDTEVGAIIAKSSAEAQLQVTLVWGKIY